MEKNKQKMWLIVGAVILGIFLVNQFGAGTILGGDELGAVSSFTSGNFRGTGQKFSGSVQLFDGVLTGNNKNCESYAKQIAPYLVRTENVVANWEPVGTLKNCQCRDIYSGFYDFPPPPSCPKGWTYSETTGDRGPWSDIGQYKYSYDESTVEGNYNCDNLIISKGTPTDYARLYTDININQLHTEDDLISSFVANRKINFLLCQSRYPHQIKTAAITHNLRSVTDFWKVVNGLELEPFV